jgi:UDP-N-acetylglucosamine 2-epimerase
MVDSLKFGITKARSDSNILKELKINAEEPFFLLTLHRPYNVDDPHKLQHILSSLDTLGTKIFFPVHPRTRKMLQGMTDRQFVNIHFIAPQAYLDFLTLMDNCSMMLSDSGGIQKEAYILEKRCVTLRPETEWVETVDSGWNMLLPPEDHSFPEAIRDFQEPTLHPDIFGQKVAQRMLDELEKS